MSFTGHLEDLAIVDVIQLLHSARKSGTLCVQCGEREGQLVFNEGFIISANHYDSSIRIGKILVDQGSIRQADLERILQEQTQAGEKRQPLIGMLIESGLVSREKAFKGLEHLIEMTIVEMVSWTRGIFTLDVDQINISDEYRYFPETLKLDLSLDTQMLLMDALRIFDEKKRDGEIVEPDWSKEEPVPTIPAAIGKQPRPPRTPKPAPAGRPSAPAAAEPEFGEPIIELSPDDLGLDGIEEMETRIPEVYSALKTFDPLDIHRQTLAQSGGALSAEQSEELAGYLAGFASRSAEENRRAASSALLLVSRDTSLSHQLMTVCKSDGYMVFTIDSADQLASRAEAAMARGLSLLLLFDAPGKTPQGFTAAELVELRQSCRKRFGHLPQLQLAAADDPAFAWQAYRDGVRTVIPRPAGGAAVSFLEALRSCVRGAGQAQPLVRLDQRLAALARQNQLPTVAMILLQAAAEQFPRALTLVVRKGELVAERGIGLAGSSREPAPAPAVRIPLDRPSLLQRVMESGELFYGPAADPLLEATLFAAIGAPGADQALLLPLVCRGRTLCLTYADFGAGEPGSVLTEALQIAARHAGLVLDNALYRKQAAKPA